MWLFELSITNLPADDIIWEDSFPCSRSNKSTPLTAKFSLFSSETPSFADNPCFKIYPPWAAKSLEVSNVNELTLTFVLTINVPWLTLDASFNWNLFPATSPWGCVVVTVVIPLLNVLPDIWEEGLTTNAYWFCIGFTSEIDLWTVISFLLLTCFNLKYESDVTPIPVNCSTKSVDTPILPEVKPAPDTAPSKTATPLPAIRLVSKYPLSPDVHPDPAFVISNESTAPPPTTTFASVPFQVVSFCVTLLKTFTFKCVPLV